MNLILQIHEALVLDRTKGLKNFLHRHDALSHRHLALFALEAREVFHVHVKQPRTHLVNRLHDLRACANRMPNVDTAPHARIHTLHRLQYIPRRMPEDKLWHSPLDVLKAVKGMDPRMGCCIDVGHTVRAGTEVVQAIHEVGARLFNVHMKDLTSFQSKESQVAVGEGIMPVKKIFEGLGAIKYKGFVDLEYEIHADHPMPGVIGSFAYMHGVMAAASVLKRKSGATGPKVSSRATDICGVTAVSTVGSKKRPPRAWRWPPTRTFAPFDCASRMWLSTF